MKRYLLIIFACSIMLSCAGTNKRSVLEDDARDYGCRALVQFDKGNFIAAMALYKDAYAQSLRSDLVDMQALYRFNIGRVFYEASVYDSAMDNFTKAKTLYLLYNDTVYAIRASGFQALTLSALGQHDSATAILANSSWEIIRRCDPSFWLILRGTIQWRKDHSPEAGVYLDEAAKRCKGKGRQFSLANIYFYRAGIEALQGRLDLAADYLDKSLRLTDQVSQQYRRWKVLLASAEVAFCSGDKVKGKYFYDRAVNCIPQGIIIPQIETVSNCKDPLY